MNCPYCSHSSDVSIVGAPTVALLTALAPGLALPILAPAALAAMVAGYRLTGKKIYKCTRCNKYFIA